jgi:hypothetical protein
MIIKKLEEMKFNVDDIEVYDPPNIIVLLHAK